jgi:NADH:ubiquinone oxidoreductase subunit 4 (subunit M)
VASREIGWRDGIVLAPLVLCILGLALYPQLILHRTDPSVKQTVAKVTGGPAPKAQLANDTKAHDWEPTLIANR